MKKPKIRKLVKGIVESILEKIQECVNGNWGNFRYPANLKFSKEEDEFLHTKVKEVFGDTVDYRIEQHGNDNVVSIKVFNQNLRVNMKHQFASNK